MTKELNAKQQQILNSPDMVDVVVDLNDKILLEQVEPDEYSIGYTIFLIPENPSHKLTDRLAESLPDYLTGICKSSGWKLDFVKVNPEYVQWILLIRPVVTTMQIVQQVRTKTAEKIFDEFRGELDMDDREGFWAKGYLLLHGKHPDSGKVIENYIRLIRQQQER